jgi:hypothetical protein
MSYLGITHNVRLSSANRYVQSYVVEDHEGFKVGLDLNGEGFVKLSPLDAEKLLRILQTAIRETEELVLGE